MQSYPQLCAVALLLLAATAFSARLPRDAEAEAAEAPAAKEETTKYSSKFDSVDLDQILASERLLNNYFKCLMEKGPCTPEGAELRRLLPDALESECSKCSVKQREGTEKVIAHLVRNKPEQWSELQAKYDPTGLYKNKYEKYAEERNIKA